MSIAVIGASSGPGRLLFEALQKQNIAVVGVARSQRGLGLNEASKFHEFDAMQVDQLERVVSDCETIIHCSRPEILTALIKHTELGQRLIALGSTRIYTRFPDDKCDRLSDLSHVLSMGNLNYTLLHPTMIYGAPGLNNIERVMKFARLAPVIPLPQQGQALIQPVAASDVVDAILACLASDDMSRKTMVIPGPVPMTYRCFIEHLIDRANTRCRVISMPYPLMVLFAAITNVLPGVPTITRNEVQRLLEDKNFDPADFCRLIGRTPMTFEEGVDLATL